MEEGTFQVSDVLDIVHPDDKSSFRKALRAVVSHHRATHAVTIRVGRGAYWRSVHGRLTNMLLDADVAGIVFHALEVSVRWAPERPGASAAVAGLWELSPREFEIVTMLLAGDRVPAIAESLFIAQSSVRNHLSSVFRKLNVRSQQELIVLLRERRTDRPAGSDGPPMR